MKKIVILLLMILPLPASASVQVMSARLLGSVSATTVVPMGDVESGVSESVQAVGLIPMGGKFQNFYSTTTEGFSGTGSITMELRKNGATIMTCSLTCRVRAPTHQVIHPFLQEIEYTSVYLFLVPWEI